MINDRNKQQQEQSIHDLILSNGFSVPRTPALDLAQKLIVNFVVIG